MKELKILASGSGWLAVEKPSGISVHNEPGKDVLFLTEERIRTDGALRKRLSMDSSAALNPVHRLDRETSGVLLLACRPEILSFFSKQFESRSVKKRYRAVLHGTFPQKEGEGDWRTWNLPLTRDAGGRKDPAGRGRRVRSETRYRIIDQTPHYTLVELDLLTGRKHQIRRHAKLSGHPVTGDKRYGSPRSIKFLKETCSYDRLGLHAVSLTLVTPESETPLTISSEKLPYEMVRLLSGDRQEDGSGGEDQPLPGKRL